MASSSAGGSSGQPINNGVGTNSAAAAPFVFVRELAVDTDLHATPEHWLTGQFSNEPFIPGANKNKNKHGIRMKSISTASQALSCVGRVDMVTEAANVKQLLALPFADNSGLSFMVHRIGRTLILDKAPQPIANRHRRASHGDYPQLMAAKLADPMKSSVVTVASKRKAIEEKLMLSKFLYHSLEESGLVQQQQSFRDPTAGGDSNEPMIDEQSGGLLPDPLQSDPLLQFEPEPNVSATGWSESAEAHASAGLQGQSGERPVYWSFEDSRLLVTTDMPIFGSGQHPCVSLRLRDMKKPITVLTGLDYWLDQLMCNVPEVLMCYHLDGLVQKYELLSTDELPDCTETPFSVDTVRQVAANMLSFLKTNATKEGHTYWLFKAEDDDVVKLYDLNSVCGDLMETDADANPYTLPVGMLMYRVAHNLQQHARCVRRVANTSYRLLRNCLELLPDEKYPQVTSSVHYLLANLYVLCACETTTSNHSTNSTGVSTTGPNINQSTDDSFDADFADDVWTCNAQTHEQQQSVAMTSVTDLLNNPVVPVSASTNRHSAHSHDSQSASSSSQGGGVKRSALPNCSNIDDSCKQALEHVYEGLEYVEKFELPPSYPDVSSNNNNGPLQELDLAAQVVNPLDAIPLKYEPLWREEQCRQLLPFAVRRPRISTWQTQLLCLLLSRAAVAYRLLADCHSRLTHHGRALRLTRYAIECAVSVLGVHDSLCRVPVGVARSAQLCKSLIAGALAKCADQYTLISKLAASEGGRHEYELLSAQVRTHHRDRTILAVAAKHLRAAGEPKLEKEFAWATSEFPSGCLAQRQLAIRLYSESLRLMQQWKLNTKHNTNGAQKGNKNKNENNKTHKQPTRSAVLYSSISAEQKEVQQRLGNVQNECAKQYTAMMNDLVINGCVSESDVKQAACLPTEPTSRLLHLNELSLDLYQAAVVNLRAVDDVRNEALVHSNVGRVHRIYAHAIARANANQEWSKKEEELMEKAIASYKRAQECVCVLSEDDVTRVLVTSQLAGVHYSWAQHMQDRPPISWRALEQIEKDIVYQLYQSLHVYEQLTVCAVQMAVVQKECVVRMIDAHSRLASLHHQQHRTLMASHANDSSTPKATLRRLKQVRMLAVKHYEKSSLIYETLVQKDAGSVLADELAVQHLRVCMQHVALHETLAEWQTGSAGPRSTRAALRVMFTQAMTSLHVLANQHTEQQLATVPMDTKDNGNDETSCSEKVKGEGENEEAAFMTETSALLCLVLNRLQHLLLTLLKHYTNAKSAQLAACKSAYTVSLQLKADNETLQANELYEMFVNIQQLIGGILDEE